MNEKWRNEWDDQKYLPVYIDLRTFKPTLESDNDLYYALIIFQEIVVEVLKCVYVNLDYLYREYTVLEFPQFYLQSPDFINTIINNFQKMPKI